MRDTSVYKTTIAVSPPFSLVVSMGRTTDTASKSRLMRKGCDVIYCCITQLAQQFDAVHYAAHNAVLCCKKYLAISFIDQPSRHF